MGPSTAQTSLRALARSIHQVSRARSTWRAGSREAELAAGRSENSRQPLALDCRARRQDARESRNLAKMKSKALSTLFLALFGLAAIEARPLEREPLRLTYLANEGFLAEVGDTTLLFDGFLAKPAFGYPALPADLLDKLGKAEAPFDAIDLALTSHNHGDHFQGEVARDFLLASGKTPLVTTPQVVEALSKTSDWPDDQTARIHGIHPEVGESTKRSFDGIEFEALRIPHGGVPGVQNLGCIVRVGGHSILHLGDAETALETFAPYEKQLKDVSLVLAPVWFFSTEEGRAVLDRYLPAKARVAMHFPMQDAEKVVTSFLANHKQVLAFSKAMQSTSIE